jgi:hypothetical protein
MDSDGWPRAWHPQLAAIRPQKPDACRHSHMRVQPLFCAQKQTHTLVTHVIPGNVINMPHTTSNVAQSDQPHPNIHHAINPTRTFIMR